MINCMDMTNDAFLNFGATPVARSVEDDFPYAPGETYDLQKGNAAAHVLQAMYNALYFGELVLPDFDMFESTNPNASLHAWSAPPIARRSTSPTRLASTTCRC